MGEQYVRPPLIAREAPPAWRALWRYRVTALALLVLLLVVGSVAFEHLSGATSQDPGLSSLGRLSSR
jgi:hypothetical protein